MGLANDIVQIHSMILLYSPIRGHGYDERWPFPFQEHESLLNFSNIVVLRSEERGPGGAVSEGDGWSGGLRRTLPVTEDKRGGTRSSDGPHQESKFPF